MTLKEKYKIYDDDYYKCVSDLLENDLVKKMDYFIQHGITTTLKHSIDVSYKSYKIAKKMDLDYVAAARAGLLHDFYLYDWHDLGKEKSLFKKHGYTHSTTALVNAKDNFKLSEKEENIILSHMWPLNLTKIPKYKESMLVCMVDKYISTKETVNPYLKVIKNYS